MWGDGRQEGGGINSPDQAARRLGNSRYLLCRWRHSDIVLIGHCRSAFAANLDWDPQFWPAMSPSRAALRLEHLRCPPQRTNIVGMRLRVFCYSGRKEGERPLRFQLEDSEYFVEEVIDQWYGPDSTFFKVRAGDGNLYVLRRLSSTPEGEWSLESFRDLTRGG